MKGSYLLFTLAVMSLGLSAQGRTYTANDYVGKQCAILVSGKGYNYTGHFQEQYCSEVEQGSSSNEIIIKNFMGLFDLPATISNNGSLTISCNKIYTAANGQQLKLGAFTREIEAYLDRPEDEEYQRKPIICSNFNYPSSFASTDAAEMGEAFYVTFTNPIYQYSYVWGYGTFEQGFFILGEQNLIPMGSITMMFVPLVDTAVETNNDGSTATYQMEINVMKNHNDEGGYREFTMINFLNCGLYYENYVENDVTGSETKSAIGKLYDDGRVVVDNTGERDGETLNCVNNIIVGGSNDSNHYEIDINSSTYYKITDYDRYESTYVNSDFYEIYRGECWAHAYLCSSAETNKHMENGWYTATTTNVTGTWEFGGTPVHTGETLWAEKSGGDLGTIDNITVTFGPAGIYSAMIDKFTYFADKTVVSTHYPCTHDASLSVSDLAMDNVSGLVAVEGVIQERVNNDYVDSYDLYIVPGSYSSIAEFESTHPETGHPKAQLIASGIKSVARSGDENIPFNVHNTLDPTDFNKSNYTLFLKANYQPETQLEGTFHGLNSSEVTTGIGAVLYDANAPVEYYNLQGQRVDNPANGIFIRRQGSKSEKVAL